MNNVTNIGESNQQPANPDSTLNKLKLWRETKSEHKQTKIPDEIWLEIFSLEDRYNRLFSILCWYGSYAG